MPITEVYGADDPATPLDEHDLGARPPSSGASADLPGHEHDNDATALAASYDVIDQEWFAREAQGADAPWQSHIPAASVGQDYAGGHQAAYLTLLVIPPGAGAPLFGSAVQQLLGRDYERVEARILSTDGPLIISQSKEIAEQAWQLAQQAPYVSGQTTGLQSNPPAGSNFTFTNTTGQAVELLAFTATFTASAVAGSRFPGYQIQDAAGNLLAAAVDGTAVIASASVNIRAYIGATQQNSGSGNVAFPLPAITIPPGGKFVTTGLTDAGDQWSAVVLTLSQNPGGTPNYAGPGSWLPAGAERVIRNGDELFATLPGASQTHVTITVSRRLPRHDAHALAQ